MRILYLALLFSNLIASNADSLFVRGNYYFDEEKYVKATRSYERLLNSVEHADLYFNLGNAYYRMGEVGHAVWAYEKGLQFEPRNRDIKHNLEITNTRVKDRIDFPDGFVLLDWYNAYKNSRTINDLLMWGSVFLLLVGLVYVLGQFRFLDRQTTAKLQMTFVILTILIHGICLDKYWDIAEKPEGVIVSTSVNVYSVPAVRDEMIVFKIHEGLKAEITQSQDNWVEIILLDGKKGWIPVNTIRPLS
jgi:tetratricopeptide (TPR) repeat protein